MPQADMHIVTDLETRALTLPEQAQTIIIKTPNDYLTAGEFVKQMDALLLEIDGAYDDNILAAHKLHKGLIAKKKTYYDPPSSARKSVRKLMTDWDTEQEKKAKEEETRLRDLARKAEEDAKLQEAIAAEAAGHQEEAQAIMEEEVYVPPIIIQNDTPKVQGVQFRVTWKFKVVDQRKIPAEYLLPDLVKIGAVVRAMKGSTNIPGIEVYSEKA